MRALVAAMGLAAGVILPVAAQAPLPAPREEHVEDLPPGLGREEAFGLCSACHAYRVVANQGLSKDRWDETLTWMSDRHAMPPLEGEERRTILDYLAKAHPPKTSAGGFRNPFLD